MTAVYDDTPPFDSANPRLVVHPHCDGAYVAGESEAAAICCILPPDDSPLWAAVPNDADGVDFYQMTIDDDLAALIDPAYLLPDGAEYAEATPTLTGGN